jgi:hypothetical protein
VVRVLPEPGDPLARRIVLGFAVGGAKGLLLRLPESPRWLIRRDDRDAARAVLERVRPSGYDVDNELDEMAELARKEQTASTRGWSGLRERWVRPALVLGCGIAIFTQLSGIEMIVYYSPTILTDAGPT